jgi:hypothetical protein
MPWTVVWDLTTSNMDVSKRHNIHLIRIQGVLSYCQVGVGEIPKLLVYYYAPVQRVQSGLLKVWPQMAF